MTTKSEILGQIRAEYQLGESYVEPRRQQKLEQLERLVKQNKSDGLVNINMVYNYIDTLIAATYSTEPQVRFISRDSVMETEQVDTLNYMAQFDQQEQDYDQVDYQAQRDRYYFGVAIKYKEGFDLVKKSPLFYSINPMTAVFDPFPTQVGKYSADQYRFFGFTLRSSIRDLKSDKDYDQKALSELLANEIDKSEKLYKQAQSVSSNVKDVSDGLLINANVTIYHHLTRIDGKKYIITTDGDKKVILRQKEIKPILKEEKKGEQQVPRPIALYFYKPMRGRPMGISITDLLEDKEKAKTMLFNANLMKARYEAFGGRYVVNSNIIKNKEDILKPSMGPQYIFTNDRLQPGESLQNVMMPLQGERMSQDPITMSQLLEREAISDTKQDQMQMGIVPDKSMTKAEQQSVQANANLLTSLNLKTYMWGEKDFRFLRWRTYQEYFSVSDTKFIHMGQDYNMKSVVITRDKFDTKWNPYIIVGTKSDLDAMTEKQKAYWNAALPMILNDSSITPTAKLIAQRTVAKLNGMPQNKINDIYDLKPAESMAMNYLELLNEDIVPKSLFTDPSMDYQVLWIYLNRAQDTPAKEKVLPVLRQYLIEQGMQTQQMGDLSQIANSSANIMQSQLAQQNMGQGLVTRDVLSDNSQNG